MFSDKSSRTQRRLIQIFAPAAFEGQPVAPVVASRDASSARAWWEWAILLLTASAGAGWSVWADSFERALPFCVGAALGLALAIFARGGWGALALLALGGAGFIWPESARVPWILGGALGLALAYRAPVSLLLASAGALSIFWIRDAREQFIPWPMLGALVLAGLLLAALMRAANPAPSGFWPIGALSIVGGALFAETLAQGAGVASFALGGALLCAWVSAPNNATASAHNATASAHNATGAADSLWSVAAIVALWRALEAQVPALRFGADAGDLTVLWGALLSAAVVHYRTRALAPLVCALAPLMLWFGWGPKVVPGLLLGALIAPLFQPRALPLAAVFVCALVGLAPFALSLPPQTRADKLMMGAALVAAWLLFDALIKWLARERTT